MNRQTRRYGWKPDLPDVRDHVFAAPMAITKRLPARVDLRKQCPPVYDQTDLGSCVAQAVASAIQFNQMKQKLTEIFVPSRLFIYYNARVIEGTTGYDAGAELRDGIKTVVKQGAPPESEWPYNTRKFTRKPPTAAYTHALKHQVTKYMRVPQTVQQLCGCLAAGYPVVFGFTVYESFETEAVTRTGTVPMPRKGEVVLGGHGVKLVGYNMNCRRWIVKNSWGLGWGDRGYFTMPFEYLTNQDMSADFWTIRLVEA